MPEQTEAINTFLDCPIWLENAKNSVEQYCRDQVMEDTENSKKENIFSYIKPQGFLLNAKRTRASHLCANTAMISSMGLRLYSLPMVA